MDQEHVSENGGGRIFEGKRQREGGKRVREGN